MYGQEKMVLLVFNHSQSLQYFFFPTLVEVLVVKNCFFNSTNCFNFSVNLNLKNNEILTFNKGQNVYLITDLYVRPSLLTEDHRQDSNKSMGSN